MGRSIANPARDAGGSSESAARRRTAIAAGLVHAEMAAIVDAAARGVSVRGATLYTTTYPCHNCARHIIAAGIGRVVYVEPYPKSLTYELHKDAMVNDSIAPNRVAFQAFIGLAPRRYMQFFEMVPRKRDGGDVVEWINERRSPEAFRQASCT